MAGAGGELSALLRPVAEGGNESLVLVERIPRMARELSELLIVVIVRCLLLTGSDLSVPESRE